MPIRFFYFETLFPNHYFGIQEAIKLDPNAKEASEGMNRVMTAKYASRNDPEQVKQRAMNDPEVAQIMGDPGMRMILEQV